MSGHYLHFITIFDRATRKSLPESTYLSKGWNADGERRDTGRERALKAFPCSEGSRGRPALVIRSIDYFAQMQEEFEASVCYTD